MSNNIKKVGEGVSPHFTCSPPPPPPHFTNKKALISHQINHLFFKNKTKQNPNFITLKINNNNNHNNHDKSEKNFRFKIVFTKIHKQWKQKEERNEEKDQMIVTT